MMPNLGRINDQKGIFIHEFSPMDITVGVQFLPHIVCNREDQVKLQAAYLPSCRV
jgi:hypothetical protein